MEKEFLKGITPDGLWNVRVVVDLEKKIKRLDFERKTSDQPANPPNLEDPEWEGIKDLLI